MSIYKLAVMLLALAPALSAAEPAYPVRPIRLVVGFPPAGLGDAVARVLGDAMAKSLGQPVVVDNKPGAGGTLATEFVARAAADGYTILLSTGSIFGADQVLYKSAKYDGFRDFTPITMVLESPMIVVVNKALGVSDLRELAAKSKANPGRIFHASPGNGLPAHLAGVAFNKLTGASLTHVPYKGGAPAAQSVVANDTQVTFSSPTGVLPFIKSGTLLALAVTSKQRSPFLPDVPTTVEAGLPEFQYGFWMGLVGPAHIPKEAVDKLFLAARTALSDPIVKEKLLHQGVIATPSTTVEEFRQRTLRDGPAEAQLVRDSSAKVE
jgi:tripartite-type tricarboxylate transporter receptor subunit TctC